ncbi:tRNA lysidine(34) synthetase TilS [Chelativorans salis]|uniref:tRNA(Ile)-lysidine synthase n=1 Tax=Chelativorans salis TaxID=2978478 RepID=A0ABT2LRY3_9HYPH|nr:tRNA lysidine(34) synthetase TilS [Chelativorans sp. EGI FJ00035]MCT7377288.1 tRNA lysidine(34) synthetase TilS [Chelativorans sp. EGI FJ00035]
MIAAVSGGGDSLALLLLLHDYLKSAQSGPSLLAVTVDHGLRPEAAEEARAVGRLCAAHGIAHRVLRWEGRKPATGLSAAAREARLRLLAGAADEAGSDLVLTGHAADDQAETLAMRLKRGGGRGTAGIAPATLYDGRVWFVRPLLGARRSALRRLLQAQGIGWFEDPSNKDRRFERARVRQTLDEEDVERLVDRARETGLAREEAGEHAATFISGTTRLVVPGLLCLPHSALRQAEESVALYTLRILLAVAGGTQHLPDETRTAAILARAGDEGFRATLSRAVIAARRGGLYIHRERRNLPRLAVAGGMIWDGRYRVQVRETPSDLMLAPFGTENVRASELADLDAPAGLARSALAAEPALWRDGRFLGRASEGAAVSLQSVAGPWARFLPTFDLAPARAVAKVIGGATIQPSPWRGHKGDNR